MTSNNNNTCQRLTGFRACLPFYILYDLELNSNHLRFYGQIEQMESNPNPAVRPSFSYAWMAKQLGINRRNTINIAKTLIKKGYLEHVQIAPGKYIWRTKKGQIDTPNNPNIDEDEDHEVVSLDDMEVVSLSDTEVVSPVDTQRSKKLNPRNKDLLKPFVDSKKSTEKSKCYRDDELFMEFYKSYPNKQKPATAYKAFLKLKPSDEVVAMLIADVQNRINNNWKGRDKSKIPFPATYLNSREWEGEIYDNAVVATKKSTVYKTWSEIVGDCS